MLPYLDPWMSLYDVNTQKNPLSKTALLSVTFLMSGHNIEFWSETKILDDVMCSLSGPLEQDTLN